VHAEALTVMVAVTAYFMFNRWDLEILLYYHILHIPWCIRYHVQSLRLETFENFYVACGCGCGSPELYSVGPDWYEYSFVDEELFIENFDLGPSNQYILVRAVPSCFHLVKICLCQVILLSRCSPRYLTSSV
jgi:hypothetical protein